MMNKQDAQAFLSLAEGASRDAIRQASDTKREQLQAKLKNAPTDALKTKFEMMLLQVDEAAKVLLTEASATTASSPLSQTKLADLPSMAAGDAEQLALQPGQVLAARYEVKELLGQGGMGAVYRAFDRSMSRDIALKVLLPSLIKNDNARERFLNEARISQQLSHPYIVNVFDVQNDGDLYFLTMELLEGQDLRQVMENRKLARQPFTVDEAQEIAKAIGAALSYAHKYTIHRDLKPENVWLTDEGVYKLMDFGIAQVQSTSQRTKTGAAMGTAYYMAPEQLKGAKDIDGRADQYALAVLIYELLSGEVPAGRIEPLYELDKTIPKAISAIVDKGLSARPENRFASIDEFVSALSQAKAPKASKTKTTNYSSSNTSTKWPMVAAVFAVLVVGGGLFGTGVVTVDDVKKLLPASKEIIAAQKAQVAKVQGEIKVLKQRLENGRRQLDSDVRDAERNKSTDLARLKHWQDLTENAIFTGSQLTELEGDYAMAETLLRDNVFEQAQAGMNGVREGYRALLESFNSAEALWSKQQANITAETRWQQLTQDYQLTNPPAVLDAQQSMKQAIVQQRMGEFVKAGQAWDEAAAHWQSAQQSVAGEVAKLDQQRQTQRAAAAAAAAAAKAKAEAERLAALTGKLVAIPAGSFMMGSKDYYRYEPVHRVSIKAFEMMEHEVTFAQWDACVQAGGCAYRPEDRGWGRGTRPVMNVSWNDITQQFIPWLNKTTGKTFRLPTEAEWEYAARSGSTTKFSWGNAISCSQARYEVSDRDCGDDYNTVPVKSYSPNAFGLYDMHGNVWEWVQDCKNETYRSAPRDGSAWLSGDCDWRMLRGGSFDTDKDHLWSANRFQNPRSTRKISFGFRLVQDL